MDSSLNAQLRELEETHINFEVRSSSEELDKILADEFGEIGNSGIKYDKKDFLELYVVLSDMALH
ncbi:nuclear transport factor 2 family protein [Pontibacillus yanchengensis]|uniref:nuclear transport factor 2 family protein n=1 Tax=Pontibacillus yanchengensis TaxID=462910 RepID=UPI001F4197DF|nr:nuclear transport factor 2 family protein [Pontibacillus yanchengensis]